MLPGRRRRSLAAPPAKFAVVEMTSILNQSSLQSADDRYAWRPIYSSRVLELVRSLARPKGPNAGWFDSYGNEVNSSCEVGIFRAFLVFCSFSRLIRQKHCHWTFHIWICEFAKVSGQVASHARQRPFLHGTVVTPSGTFCSYTSAVAQSNWFSSCQNTCTNECSVDDVVDLTVTRLSASTFSAREAMIMMPIRCRYGATTSQQHWCGCTRGDWGVPTAQSEANCDPDRWIVEFQTDWCNWQRF